MKHSSWLFNGIFLKDSLKILIEPSCATTLAAIIKNKEFFKDKYVGVILTGGNVDLEDTKKSFG